MFLERPTLNAQSNEKSKEEDLVLDLDLDLHEDLTEAIEGIEIKQTSDGGENIDFETVRFNRRETFATLSF